MEFKGKLNVLAWPAFSNRKDNPYNYLLYMTMRELNVDVIDLRVAQKQLIHYFRMADILHIHWPEYGLSRPPLECTSRVIKLFSVLSLAKYYKVKVVWTVHNLAPHERLYPWLEPWFYRILLRFVDGVIYLSERSKQAAEEKPWFATIRNKPFAIIPHGHFKDFYPNIIDRNRARERLGIGLSERVLLFLGQLRPYKGLEELIESFSGLNDTNIILIIAGRPYDEKYLERIRRLSRDDQRVRFYPVFIEDDKIQVFMNASDLVILPYTDILNSGSALLALSFNRPVLVPRLGSLPELAEEIGSSWVKLYEPPLKSQILEQEIRNLCSQGEAPLDIFDWRLIAGKTHAFYARLMT